MSSAIAASLAALSARPARISWADSRSTAVSYLPASGEAAMVSARSAAVIGPMRDEGGRISVR